MKTDVPILQIRKFRRSSAKLLCQFCAAISIFILSAGLADATIYTINVASGTSGSATLGQSYNELRAVDVTVLSPLNLAVSSMTLSGINGSGTAEAEIFDAHTQALIASAQGTLTGGTITLPVSATLVSGDEYRIGFFGILGSGNGFIPSGWTIGHESPYMESTGLLQINSAWDTPVNGFPSEPNLEVPLITMQVTTVPEPGNAALLGLGLFLSILFRKRFSALFPVRILPPEKALN